MSIEESLPLKVPHQRRRQASKLNDLGVMLDNAGHKKEALLAFKKALLNDPENYIPYFNIGNIMRDLEQNDRAIFFYEKAIALSPDDMDIYLNLAPLYRLKKENSKALATYQRILAIDPDNAVASHFLLALQGKTPSQPPQPYVEKLFDSYAESFDDHLTQNLNYATPQRLCELIFQSMKSDQKFASGLDMGCGTGLLGELLAPHCHHLSGIDLSRKMLDQATAKGCYQLLIKSNIIDYLANPQTYDLFIAADVLPYFGDLAPLFAALRARCRDQAIFALSSESTPQGGYTLATSGRYQHSRSYIMQLAEHHGFHLMVSGHECIRTHHDTAIMGDLFLFRAESGTAPQTD